MQSSLFETFKKNELIVSDEVFLDQQLITYLGNKRSLIGFIEYGIKEIVSELGGSRKVSFFDVFSGTGVVSRMMKKHSHTIIANDLEFYSYISNKCYLSNYSEVDEMKVCESIDYVNRNAIEFPVKGFVSELYAPSDDGHIKQDERVFYTTRNSSFIDSCLYYLEKLSPEIKHLIIAPLIFRCSVHTNTSGVFKGFYKNSNTGIGQFGGDGKNALKRIMESFTLPYPIFSQYECDIILKNEDSNKLAKNIQQVDIAYVDPPYNQHPYGSNYFMLNLIAKNKRPDKISDVSGIPVNWNRSDYNKKQKIKETLRRLLKDLNAKYILLSYNNEGFLNYQDLNEVCSSVGEIQVFEKDYSAFKGSRNLNSRNLYVTEFLFKIKK